MIVMESAPEMGHVKVAGLSPDEASVIEHVVQLLQVGMSPRIINLTPDDIREQIDVAVDEGLSDPWSLRDNTGELWRIAKDADLELENTHHWFDGLQEFMREVAFEAAASALNRSVALNGEAAE